LQSLDKRWEDSPNLDWGLLGPLSRQIMRAVLGEIEGKSFKHGLGALQVDFSQSEGWLTGSLPAATGLPVEAAPRFSQQILSRCENTRQPLFGTPTRLGDSRSVVLSDLDYLLAIPLERGSGLGDSLLRMRRSA